MPDPQNDAISQALDASFAKQDDDLKRQAALNVSSAAAGDANQAGQAQRLSQQTGIGADLVQSNFDEAKRRAAMVDMQQRTLDPVLSLQLTDPKFAAIAHDQLDNLSGAGKLFNALRPVADAIDSVRTLAPVYGFGAGPLRPQQAMERSAAMAGEVSTQFEAGHLQHEMQLLGYKAAQGQATPDDIARISDIKQRLTEIGPGSSFPGQLANFAGQMRGLGLGAAATGTVTGLVTGGATALATAPTGVGEAATPAAAMLGFKLGAGLYSAEDFYKMAAGQAYLDMLDKGVDHNTAVNAAAGVGLLNSWIMSFGARAGMQPFAKAMDSVLADKMAEAMVQPTVSRAVARVAGQLALNSVEGGGAMAAQDFVSQMGQELAKSYDEGKLETSFQTPEGREELASRMVDTFVNGAMLTAAVGAAPSMLHLSSEMGRAIESQRTAQFFEGLSQNAAESEVRKRNPNAYQNFIAAQANGTKAENIYIDGQQMASVLHQAGIGPDDLAKSMPELPGKIADAAATGGDVTIPTAEYAAKLAGTPLGKAMEPHMRLDPDSLSAAEGQAVLQQHQQMMEAARQQAEQQMATNTDFAKSAKVVENNIYDQLVATGKMPPDMARTNAQFMRDFVVTQAARMQVTPEQFFEKYPNLIQAAEGSGAELQQADLSSPQFQKWFGKSKVADESGNPVVAYHGTASAFPFFDIGKAGALSASEGEKALFFSTDPNIASNYADMAARAGEAMDGDRNAQVYPVYLRLEKPFVSDLEHYTGTDFAREIQKAKKGGHDGVLFPKVTGVNERGQIAVFSPEQVKSVFNRGTFDVSDRNMLYQATRGGFDPNRMITMLGEKADASTFLHETSHYFLTVIGDMARQANADPTTKADFQTLLNWFGVKDADAWHAMSLEEQRKYHEQFAYNFEKYLAEGKAPSLEMQGLFDRFGAWLKRVYVSIRDDLNTIYRKQHGEDLPIMTGEVRDVMDRMLASDEQIKRAETVRNMEPIFRTQAESEMPPEQWAAYQALRDEARSQATAELTKAQIRQMQWLSKAKSAFLKDMQAQHEELRNTVREEVAKQLQEDPRYQAMDFLKTGKLPEINGEEVQALVGNKLDKEAVQAMFRGKPGEKPDLSKLRGMTAKDGLHPDIVAPMFGFDNGEQMIRQIIDAKPIKEEIENRTDQQMVDRHRNYNPDAEVEKALHNEASTRFVAAELRYLARAAEPVRVMQEAAANVARQIIAQKPISEIDPREHSAAESRAAKQAMDLLRKGDREGAARAKQNQLVQHALVKAAIEAREEADKSLRYLRKFDNPSVAVTKAIGADYMDRVNELLAGYNFAERRRGNETNQDLGTWITAQYDKTGIMPAVSDELIANLGTMHFKDMTIGQLRDLRDGIKSLEYVGRGRTRLMIEGAETTVDNLVAELQQNMKGVKHTEPIDIRPDLIHAKGMDKMSAKFLSSKLWLKDKATALTKMEQFFQWLDAGKDAGLKEAPINGPMQRVFRLAAHAETREEMMRRSSQAAMDQLRKNLQVSNVNLNDLFDIPTLSRRSRGSKVYREELIAIALNMGNESNKEKLLQGYGWYEADARNAIDKYLSKAEMEFVQGVWNHLKTYTDDINDLHRRQTGIDMKMVAASPFTTAHGYHEGGYYPVVYDGFLDRSIEEKQDRKVDQLFENNYANPKTSHGFTVERTRYKGPVYLSLSVIGDHLREVTHDLAWREAIVDMNKVLSDPRVFGEIDQTYGREYSKQFRPWLQSLANNSVFNKAGDAGWEGLIRAARTNMAIVQIGFRFTTMMVHGTSAFSNSLGEIGTKWFARGAAQFTGIDRMKTARDFIYERSPEMAQRLDTMDRDLYQVVDDIRRIESGSEKMDKARLLYLNAAKFGFRGVSFLDFASAMPTWMGAYIKAMAKEAEGGLNMSEQDAIHYADRAVRNAHGGGGIKDMSAIQRSKGLTSLLTMFYSYWNHVYNRQRDLGKGWGKTVRSVPGMVHGDFTTVRDFPRLLARSWFYFVVPQLAHALLKPSPKKDDGTLGGSVERMAEDVGLGLFSGIPIFRDMASAIASGRDYTFTPVERVFETAYKTTEDVLALTKGETPKYMVRDLAELAGYRFGLPTSQIATTGKFLWDVLDGEQDPEDMAEWWRGILTGRITK